MNNVKAMRTFIEVAKQGSFAGAAKSLELSSSSISRLVNDLEEWLGITLLRRTPHSVLLTEYGEQFLERCTAIVTATDDLQKDARDLTEQPRGTLNVGSAAHPAQRLLSPLLPEFFTQYPEVTINLQLNDDQVDLTSTGIDVAIRFGNLADSALISRKCRDIFLKLIASREFIETHGQPASAKALVAYPCITDSTGEQSLRWPINSRIRLRGPLTANDGEIVRQMAIAGQGIACLPDFFVDDDIATGSLIELFPDAIHRKMGMHLVYPPGGKMTAATRAFIDFMAERLS
jgi:DNA-binding transcriptional LysR family regulator